MKAPKLGISVSSTFFSGHSPSPCLFQGQLNGPLFNRNQKIFDQGEAIGLEPADLARRPRSAAKGGIGKCMAHCDCVAESSDDLMFLKVCY